MMSKQESTKDNMSKSDEEITGRIERAFRKVIDNKGMKDLHDIVCEYYLKAKK